MLCTANVCRSPMAEVLLRHRLGERGREEATVSSAGFLTGGMPAADQAIEVMRRRGLSLEDHVSRQVDADLLAGADLVLGMARLHVREAVVLQPEAFPRTFTLKELVRRAEEAGTRPPATDPAEWLERLHAGREPSELLGDSRRDDVADPMGRPAEGVPDGRPTSSRTCWHGWRSRPDMWSDTALIVERRLDQPADGPEELPMPWPTERDTELFDLVDQEVERQNTTLQLIASENFTSPAVIEATGSVLTNKYSEGYPGKRYYGGNQVVDEVEDLARDRAKALFGGGARQRPAPLRRQRQHGRVPRPARAR